MFFQYPSGFLLCFWFCSKNTPVSVLANQNFLQIWSSLHFVFCICIFYHLCPSVWMMMIIILLLLFIVILYYSIYYANIPAVSKVCFGLWLVVLCLIHVFDSGRQMPILTQPSSFRIDSSLVCATSNGWNGSMSENWTQILSL